MRVLKPQDILSTDDLPKEFVSTPEWSDGDPEAGVYVRTMTGRERDEFEGAVTRVSGKNVSVNLENMRALLVSKTACDEKGHLLFSPEQTDALGGKSSRVLDRLADVARRLSGLTDTDVEDLAKNSAPVQSDGSTSD